MTPVQEWLTPCTPPAVCSLNDKLQSQSDELIFVTFEKQFFKKWSKKNH
jgi:hypothetical protein